MTLGKFFLPGCVYTCTNLLFPNSAFAIAVQAQLLLLAHLRDPGTLHLVQGGWDRWPHGCREVGLLTTHSFRNTRPQKVLGGAYISECGAVPPLAPPAVRAPVVGLLWLTWEDAVSSHGFCGQAICSASWCDVS